MIHFEKNEEIQELLNKINEDIKKELSEKRYIHSIGVMKKAEELAKIYEINTSKAKLVGLAHDIGKDLSKEEKLQYAKDNNIEIDEIETVNVGLLHAKIGADICKKRYGFTQDMQNAIKYHTTGNENMDLLAKIIFVADKIEDGRFYNNIEKMQALDKTRKLAKEDIDKALLYSIDESLEFTIKKKELVHPNCIYIRNKILLSKNLQLN